MTEHHQQPSKGYYYEPVYSTSYAPRAREMHTTRQEIPDHIKTLTSCNECGVLFSTLYDLQKHVQKGCPMDEDGSNQDSDSEDNSDSAIVFDDSGFNRLVNKVLEVNEQFQQKVQSIMDRNEATERAPQRLQELCSDRNGIKTKPFAQRSPNSCESINGQK